MFEKINVVGKVYWLGVNDRKKPLFENLWPLPNGVAYNSYIINDEKTALIDTVDFCAGRNFVEGIADYIGDKPLDYLVINHMELDHTGEVRNLMDRYPNITIVGNGVTKRIFEGYFGVVKNFLDISKGTIVDLGHHKLSFTLTPWVHWPETMMTYDTTEGVLFSGDAFGSFGTLDGGIFDDEINFDFYIDEMRRYYSNIVGKYSPMVQKALAKLDGLEVKFICAAHGPLWRKDPQKVIDLYTKWCNYEGEEGVVIIFASMYGNTESVADYIARKIADRGIKNVRIFDVSKTHISFLLNEIWKYKGVILGSCSYNTEMHPNMEHLCKEIEHMGVKNKQLGIFGTYSWNGGGAKNLLKFAENIAWEQVSDSVDLFGIPGEADFAKCDKMAKAMTEKIRL